jgi:hypothetical protein
MAYTVYLSEQDQITVVHALLVSLDIKRDHVIRDPAKFRAARNQYSDAAEKVTRPVVCRSSRNNLWTWIQDQIQHSPGLPGSPLGTEALRICEAARLNDYTAARPGTNYSALFDHC